MERDEVRNALRYRTALGRGETHRRGRGDVRKLSVGSGRTGLVVEVPGENAECSLQNNETRLCART